MEPRDYLLDLIDIFIVAWVFYRLFLVFRQTRAIRVLAGVGALGLVYGVASFFRFETVLGLVNLLRGARLEIVGRNRRSQAAVGGHADGAALFADHRHHRVAGFRQAERRPVAHADRPAGDLRVGGVG